VLLELGYEVSGFDISPAMLNVAEKRLSRFGKRFSATVKDAREIKDGDARFDAVLCARFLMHFHPSEQRQFLSSVAAVARRRVVFTQGLDTPFHRARQALKRWMGGFRAPAAFPISRRELQDLLAAANLTEIRRHRVLPLLSQSIVVVAEPIRSK
jgi:ubiquinone/menaquinone biosynthesis C-methylase UbiE